MCRNSPEGAGPKGFEDAEHRGTPALRANSPRSGASPKQACPETPPVCSTDGAYQRPLGPIWTTDGAYRCEPARTANHTKPTLAAEPREVSAYTLVLVWQSTANLEDV